MTAAGAAEKAPVLEGRAEKTAAPEAVAGCHLRSEEARVRELSSLRGLPVAVATAVPREPDVAEDFTEEALVLNARFGRRADLRVSDMIMAAIPEKTAN